MAVAIIAVQRDAILLYAAASGNRTAERLFLRYSNDVSRTLRNGYGILHVAAALDDPSAVRGAVARGARVDSRLSTGSTPLHIASSLGHYNAAAALVGAGANINVQTLAAETPLGSAVEQGRNAVVDLLLAHGADCRFPPEAGYLYIAARNNHPGLFAKLRRSGASIDANSPATPLMAAVRWSSDESVRWLLAAGADPNRPSVDGETPLMWAAEGCATTKIQVLLNNGASVRARTPAGLTAVDYVTRAARHSANGKCDAAVALIRESK